MGGESSTSQTQQSTTNPWAAATPALNGILSQVQGGLDRTGVTGTENTALNTLAANGQNATNTYAPAIGGYATSLLNGGGALNQAGNVNQNYQNYANTAGHYADPNYSTLNSPAVRAALDQSASDVTNSVNGQFAAAGRDLSGMNQQTLARGITQAQAPIILNQANADTATTRGAQDSIYGAGNTNYGILSGLQQQHLANQGQGVTAAGQATSANNAGADAALQAEAQRRGIPVQALGLLAQIGIPIAGLGGTSSGTMQGTQQMSGADQFGKIAGGVSSLAGSLFGGGGAGGAGAVANAAKFISDRHAKEDITQVGTLFDGTPVYRYRYIGQPAFQIGLMAQDVEKYAPEAVGMIGQYKAVDYKLATDKAVEAA